MTEPTAPARRRVLLVVAGALAVLGLVLGGAGLLGVGARPPRPRAVAADPLPTSPPTAAAGPRQQPATGSPPASITIPAIDVASPVDSVGLEPDGTLEVPVPGPAYDHAAWYRGSPTPGRVGPSVVLGHVDSAANGPSVFYDLGRLRPGDRITVTSADRSSRTFAVDAVRSFPKDEFPSLEVYGDTAGPELRLITCGGDFDDAARSYRDNTVVFARLVA